MPADTSPPVPPDAPRLLPLVEEGERLRVAVQAATNDHDLYTAEDAYSNWLVDAARRLLAAARLAATLQDHQEQAVVVRGGEVVGVLSALPCSDKRKADVLYRIVPLPVEDEEEPK